MGCVNLPSISIMAILPLKFLNVLSLMTRKRLLRMDKTLKRGIVSNGEP